MHIDLFSSGILTTLIIEVTVLIFCTIYILVRGKWK